MSWPGDSVAPESRTQAAPGGSPLIALLGPTATGKTEIGIQIAERIGGEIVSLDRRQAYRGMESGTASPTR